MQYCQPHEDTTGIGALSTMKKKTNAIIIDTIKIGKKLHLDIDIEVEITSYKEEQKCVLKRMPMEISNDNQRAPADGVPEPEGNHRRENPQS